MKNSIFNQLFYSKIFLGLIVTGIIFTALGLFMPVQALETTLTTGSDWDSGSKSFLDTSVQEGNLQLQADGSWDAQSWRTPDLPFSAGSTFTTDGTDIYVTRGVADVLFWKYSPATNQWTELANLPRGAYYGADFVYLDGYIYAIFGGYQTAFARYSIANDTWQELTEITDLTHVGASITTDGTTIFALRGNSTQDFYKYDLSTNTWIPLSGTPSTVGAGADLVYADGNIYTPRGLNSTTMYRYTISSNTWSTVTNLPDRMNDSVDISTNGTTIFVPRENNTTTLYAYNILEDSWSTVAASPQTARYGGVVYNPSDEYLYVFRGNNTYTFWKYDISENTFVGPSDAPAGFSTGADGVYHDGVIYTPRGSNTTTFYGYTVATNSWSTLAAAPATFADDTRGVSAGSYLYFFRGSNTTTFYRYTPATNTWTTLTSAPSTVRFGGGIAYPGAGDYLYATRGNGTTSFWRYSISTDTWDDVAVADLPTDSESSYGSRVLSNGTDIYYFPGIGIKSFFHYDISEDTWNELSALPFAPYYGSDMTYYDGKIFAMAGWYKNEFWEYTIASDTWRKLQNMPGYLAQDRGPYTGAWIESDSAGNFYISRGLGTADITSHSIPSNNYVNSGTWISAIQDLEYVAEWNDFSSTVTTPSDSAISFETRTSADNSTWSEWQSVSGSVIASPENRYLQIKATLLPSTGNAESPVLHDLTISYTGDTTAPNNPDTFTGSSQQLNGTSLTSGETYSFINPYFSWSGESDAETSVEGFYVYFGTNASADPELVGEYQTSANYTVTTPFATGTYYLRIKTKDSAGNVSSDITGFTYVYNGISPAQSLSITTSDTFTGTPTNSNTAGDEIKLASKSNGFWLQESLSTTPATMQYGAKNVAYVPSTNKLYAFRGANSTTFYNYDIDTDAWSTSAPAPAKVRMGGGVVEGPEGYLYGFRGNNSTSFWRYDITANLWDDAAAADAPLTVHYGGSLVFDGNQYIYALRGNNDDAFWRYDTSSDEWETLSSTDFGATADAINNNVYHGADLAIDTENELIYAIQGNLRDGFSVFDINTNTWTVLTDLPQLPYLGASLEYADSTGDLYFIPGNSSDKMFKYSVSSETWTQVSEAPTTFYYGATLKNIGDNLYTLRGGNSNGFYKYDISKDSWLTPNRGLFGREFQGTSYTNSGLGADIVKGDGSNYYITRGLYADDFIRWDENTGISTRLANTPVGTHAGSSMAYDSTTNKIYLTGSTYVRKLFVYDIATNTWSEEVDDPPPVDSNYGGSMVYDGSRYIYFNRGGNTSSIYRFDTQGTNGAKWSSVANAPAGLGYGSELLLAGSNIYTLRGQNVANNPFYKYDITQDSWSDPAVTDLGIDVFYGGFLTNGGDGNFYAARGDNDTDFYKYSVAENTWSEVENTPAKIYQGGSGESNGSEKIHMISGSGTGSFSDGVYTYIMGTDSSGFEESGEYISQSHDLTSVYRWANLVVTHTNPSNTSLLIQTRSSDDATTWSSWTAVSQEKESGTTHTYQIKSPANRYIQVKFTFLSTDGIYSPVVEDYTINYFKDTTQPTNPLTEGLSSYSNSDPGEPLVSGTWYSHSEPYFNWPDAEATYGASDTLTGSGVAGYYVYFGPNAAADPQVDGTFQVESEFTASELVDDSSYYLLLKTVDNAGNIASDTWAPFTYKYDSSGPTPPTGLSADPSGYSSTDSFDFSWETASTSGSAITGYCYKTGASEGEYATDQCTTNLSVSAIPSHKVGANTFWVRAQDAAGNFSDYTSTPYYYVDSENAPAPPTNLSVTPTSNTTNSFAFSWDPPSVGTFYGSASNLTYYYSINALPTAQSTTATSLKSLKAGAYATLPGENVFYIVTKDEAGNINYSDYASVIFSANTSAPGIPLNIDIADVSVKSTSSWKLAISWEEPSESANVTSYSIYRSTDGENFTLRATSGGISYVDVGLTQQIYYYKVKACDSTNNCGEFSETVSLYPDGKFTSSAELISGPIESDITTSKATISWTTARTSDSRIAFGTSSGNYFEEEISNSQQVTSHILTLANLSPGTQYYYVTRWTDEDGNLGESEEKTFETQPPPSTEEPTVTAAGLDNALIQFTSKNASRVRVYYGETSAFGGVEDIVVGGAEGTHTVQLTGLTDGTKYYYKINSFDSDGQEYEGEIHSFSTLPRPKITNIKVNQVKGTAKSTLLLTWDSNTEISSIVTYYPINNPALARDEVNVTLKSGKHQMVLYDLAPQTTYGILLRGKDIAGNEAVGEVQQVTTSADTRPPVISDLKVDGEIIGTGDEATAQLLVSFKTDEPATAQIDFGEGSGSTYSQSTQEDATLTHNHLVVISELSPAKVYHLRAVSKDSFGNKAESLDKIVITPKATENALDLVVTSMSSIFGFLNN